MKPAHYTDHPMRITQYRQGESHQRVVEPGNGTRYWIIVGTDAHDSPFVALPDFGVAAVMSYQAPVMPHYVKEKLGRGLTDADCEIVAQILDEWWEYN